MAPRTRGRSPLSFGAGLRSLRTITDPSKVGPQSPLAGDRPPSAGATRGRVRDCRWRAMGIDFGARICLSAAAVGHGCQAV